MYLKFEKKNVNNLFLEKEIVWFSQGYCTLRSQTAIDDVAAYSGPHIGHTWVLYKYLTAKIVHLRMSDFPESQPLSLEMKKPSQKAFPWIWTKQGAGSTPHGIPSTPGTIFLNREKTVVHHGLLNFSKKHTSFSLPNQFG